MDTIVGSYRGYKGSCFKPTDVNAFSGIPFSRTVFYNDTNCGSVYDFNHFKSVSCNSGDVIVGLRDYQWAVEVDDEHVDAYCVKPDFDVVPDGVFVVAPSSGTYREAVCPSGKIMTGLRMYGYSIEVDDERVDIMCGTPAKSITGNTYWVSSPNAFARLSGSYKEAMCDAGDVAVGVRYFLISKEVDDEHTDILCVKHASPQVDVFFGN
jgi:hypothetical protein